MTKKAKAIKLTEDELQDQMAAPAVPATDAEVAQAAEAAPAPVPAAQETASAPEMPEAPEAPEAPAADDTPVEDMPADDAPSMDAAPADSTAPETYQAPLPGYEPAGWIKKDQAVDELKNEIKQEVQKQVAEVMGTGDPEAIDYDNQKGLETAVDVANQAPSAEDQPLVAEAETTPAEEPAPEAPVLESMQLTKEELQMIKEFRQSKASKLHEEESGRLEAPIEAAAEDEKEGTAAGAPNVADVHPEIMKEAEEVEEAEDAEEKPEEVVEEASEEVEATDTEEVDPAILADVDGEEVPEEDSFEFDSDDDLLQKISDFLDDSDMEPQEAADAMNTASDILGVIGDAFEDKAAEDADDTVKEESDEDISEDVDLEDADADVGAYDNLDDEDVADTEDDSTDELSDDVDFEEDDTEAMEESQGIQYPAGSVPLNRAEAFRDSDNLVEAYKKISERKRMAMRTYRSRDEHYGEALSRPMRINEEQKPAENSWAYDRMVEEQEKGQLDYKELLKHGFLG